MKKPTDLQLVKFNGSKKICQHCDNNLTDVDKIVYLQERWGEPRHWDELCRCDLCEHTFILRHDIFDRKGHVRSFVFTEDINNPKVNWTDNLNDIQKITIAKHVEKCSECQKRLAEEMLLDANLKSLFHTLREKR